MEAVPDIVQLTNDEADIKEQQQSHRAQLVRKLDILGCQIQESQYNRTHAAVKVRQAFLEIGFQTAAHIACHLTHGIQQSLPSVFAGDIQPETLRKIVDAGLGSLQGCQRRQLQNRCHTDSKHREESDAAQR